MESRTRTARLPLVTRRGLAVVLLSVGFLALVPASARALCQNGSIDPGEHCDDGFATNGCCTPSSTVKPGGSRCLPNPLFGCTRPTDRPATVLLKNALNGKHDRLSFKMTHAEAIDPGDLGDPTATTDYHYCVLAFDQEDAPVLIAGGTAPAGQQCGRRPCWRLGRDGGVTYRTPRSSIPTGSR